MDLKGVIFDLDSTLGDTLPICLAAFHRAFSEGYGQDFTDEEIVANYGPTEEGIIMKMTPEHLWDKCISLYWEEYENQHLDCREPFSGIKDALDLLKDRGTSLAVVTGKGRTSMMISLRYLGIENYFETVESGSDDGPVKPHLMKKVISNWGFPVEKIAYLGDAPSDVDAAKSVGVIPLSAAWDKSADYGVLMSKSPLAVFKTVDEFINWIKTGIHP